MERERYEEALKHAREAQVYGGSKKFSASEIGQKYLGWLLEQGEHHPPDLCLLPFLYDRVGALMKDRLLISSSLDTLQNHQRNTIRQQLNAQVSSDQMPTSGRAGSIHSQKQDNSRPSLDTFRSRSPRSVTRFMSWSWRTFSCTIIRLV